MAGLTIGFIAGWVIAALDFIAAGIFSWTRIKNCTRI